MMTFVGLRFQCFFMIDSGEAMANALHSCWQRCEVVKKPLVIVKKLLTVPRI